MRSIWRTQVLGRALARDIALVCLADGLVGVSFGAIAVGLGLPLWLPMLLSVLVFAGAAQFLFVGVLGAGGSPFAAVAGALLINSRHVPFGFAVADVLGGGDRRTGAARQWLRRAAGSHLMVDEAVAFTLAQRDPARRRAAYWAGGSGVFAAWNLGVLAGAYAGRAVGDTDALGLDAAFPAVLLALLLPSLTARATRRAALTGAAIALAASPFLPAGVPVLLALTGVAAALPDRPESRPSGPGRSGPHDAGRDDADRDNAGRDNAGRDDAGRDDADPAPGGPKERVIP
jgi:predicted branched-subunit amino acid permease